MWFLDRFFRRSPPVIQMPGGGRVEVIGESHYQAALWKVAGARGADRQEIAVIATLVPEPKNPMDSRAISVRVDGHVVGYIPRTALDDIWAQVGANVPKGHLGTCRAFITGGWDRGGGDVGSFGVWLDLPDPYSNLVDTLVVTTGDLAGLNVCFTGANSCSLGGRRIGRGEQEALARRVGLIVEPRVTKRTQLLVMANASSTSGKARHAADSGIRVMTERDFWPAVGVPVD